MQEHVNNSRKSRKRGLQSLFFHSTQNIRFYTKYETMRGPRMSFHHLQEYGNVPMHFAPNGNCCNKLFAPFYIYGKDTFGTQNSTYKRLLRLRVCLCLIAYRTTRAASHTMRHFSKKINVRQRSGDLFWTSNLEKNPELSSCS